MSQQGKLRFVFLPDRYMERVAEIQQIHDYAGQLASIVDNIIPEGRQKSLFFTELEGAVLRAVRALTEK
jgi:hypothetical protein